MTVKKTQKTQKTKTRATAGLRARAVPAAKGAGARLRRTWATTVDAISEAETNVGRRIRALLKANRISTKDASAMFKDLSALIGRERGKAKKELDARFAVLQARAHKERTAVGRRLDAAVQSALARFNIPTRDEVHALASKVEELSRKIDRLRR